MINKSKQKGFTLIELLVVISIIGLLSSVVLATLNTARIKARDAQRIFALKEIQKAIELYADAHNGDYPGYLTSENNFVHSASSAGEYAGVNGCGFGAAGASGDASGNSNSPYYGGIWCRFETALSPYLKSLPRTQLINGQYYYFTYKVPYLTPAQYNPPGVKTYGLGVKLESTTNPTAVNDGGYYNNWFEVGSTPAACKSRYSGGGDKWDEWDGYVCKGDDPSYVP